MAPKKRKRKSGGDDDGDAEDDRKTRRPDVSKRRAERLSLDTSCVKASLSGLLASDERFWNSEQRRVLLDVLEEQVESLSKMVVRGSMVANEVILTYLRRGLDLPELDTTFFRHCIVGESTNPIIAEVLSSEFGAHPDIPRMKGDWAAINIATLGFVTNFKNSLVVPFLSRQKAFLKRSLALVDADHNKGYLNIVTRRINGWPCHTAIVLEREVLDMIDEHRQLLGNPTDLQPERLDTALIVRYLHTFMEHYDLMDMRKISIVPLFRAKRHFMSIDTTVLFHMLKEVFERLGTDSPDFVQNILVYDSFSDANDTIHECRREMWDKTFKIDKLSKKRFDHQVDTDGVSVCLHFTRPKAGVGTGAGTSENARAVPSDWTHERVIAIDPGRNNLVTAYDGHFGTYHTLTRKQYYGTFAGSLTRIKEWEKHLEDVNTEFSRWSLRTADEECARGYRSVYFLHYDEIWANRLKRKRAKEALRIYSAKKSVVDKFFMSLRGPRGSPIPKVAYGASSLRSHGPGELSVPVIGVLKACRRFYETELVNEHLTTKKHARCGERMHPVRNEGEGTATIRGLYWCQTCSKFVNRDRNACLNIHQVRMEHPIRPAHLQFDDPFVYRAPMTLLPRLRKRRRRSQGLWGQSGS